MVFIESDLEKMILDIIKFNIIKERGVTELLFFNEFHLNIYVICKMYFIVFCKFYLLVIEVIM